MQLKEPVKVLKSDLYSVILEDANGINHFWLLNGIYDGCCQPCSDKDVSCLSP